MKRIRRLLMCSSLTVSSFINIESFASGVDDTSPTLKSSDQRSIRQSLQAAAITAGQNIAQHPDLLIEDIQTVQTHLPIQLERWHTQLNRLVGYSVDEIQRWRAVAQHLTQFLVTEGIVSPLFRQYWISVLNGTPNANILNQALLPIKGDMPTEDAHVRRSLIDLTDLLLRSNYPMLRLDYSAPTSPHVTIQIAPNNGHLMAEIIQRTEVILNAHLAQPERDNRLFSEINKIPSEINALLSILESLQISENPFEKTKKIKEKVKDPSGMWFDRVPIGDVTYVIGSATGDGDCFFHATITEHGQTAKDVARVATDHRENILRDFSNNNALESETKLIQQEALDHYKQLFLVQKTRDQIPEAVKKSWSVII